MNQTLPLPNMDLPRDLNSNRQTRGKQILLAYEDDICNCRVACDWEEIATDCVADILHFLARDPDINVSSVLDRALNHFMDEL